MENMNQQSGDLPQSQSTVSDVIVSLEDARMRMDATKEVSCHAIEIIGRLMHFQASQEVETLKTVDRLIGDIRGRTQITLEVTSHLLSMQRVYLTNLATVQTNASGRIITLADWTPPSTGFLQSLRRLIYVHIIGRGKRAERSPMDDRGTTRGGGDVSPNHVDPAAMPDQQRFVGDILYDEAVADRASNGTSTPLGSV